MSDAYVQVIPDSTGKKVDTSELTQDSGDVVERQRIAIGDPDLVDLQAAVTSQSFNRGQAALLVRDADSQKTNQLLSEILEELHYIKEALYEK